MKRSIILLSLCLALFACKEQNTPDSSTSSSSVASDTTTNMGDDTNDFVDNQTWNHTITITYNGSTATISNSVDGVSITNQNGYVSVSSTVKNVAYQVSGNGIGQLRFDSANYKFKLILSNLTLTCSDGPAINNQCHKTCYVVLSGNNTLTDGSTYASSSEDRKATLFSEGQLCFSGSGSLTVTGNYKHAIASDDYIRFCSGLGTINAVANVSDGIHSNDGIIINDGTITVNAAGDAIQCDTSSIVVTGGTTTITAAGDKGVLAWSNIDISGGTLTVKSVDKGIKSRGGNIILSGGTINITTTGDDGKGILASLGTIQLCGSDVAVTTHGSTAKGIKAVGDLTISDGTITVVAVSSSGSYRQNAGPGGQGGGPGQGGGGMSGTSGPEGIESKSTITITGGTINVKSTDDAINSAGVMTISGGNIYAYSTGNDAVDSNGNMYIKGGIVMAFGASGAETGIDVAEQKSLSISGGEIFAIGGRIDGAPNSASQAYAYSSSSAYYSTGYVVLGNGSGNIFAVKTPASYSGAVFVSSPSMTKGTTYYLQSSSSVSGTAVNGFISSPSGTTTSGTSLTARQ